MFKKYKLRIDIGNNAVIKNALSILLIILCRKYSIYFDAKDVHCGLFDTSLQ